MATSVPWSVMRMLFGIIPSSTTKPPATTWPPPTVARTDSISMRSPRNRSVPLISSISCGKPANFTSASTSVAVPVMVGFVTTPLTAIATSTCPSARMSGTKICSRAASIRPRTSTSTRFAPVISANPVMANEVSGLRTTMESRSMRPLRSVARNGSGAVNW
jgi:hypothetical protein